MKERPILFSAPMVRAILDGTKTQTRRVLKGGDMAIVPINCIPSEEQESLEIRGWGEHVKGHLVPPCPHGQKGDRLWVRETWSDTNYEGTPAISYKATQDRIDLMERDDFLCSDGSFNYDDKRLLFGRNKKMLRFDIWCHDLEGGVDGAWKPSIHMPRWASRVTLEITNISVERLQEISRNDALAEGVDRTNSSIYNYPKERYKTLWEQINGKGSWDANPWVWVIEFKRVND